MNIPLRFVRNANLDVAFGACLNSYFFARVTHMDLQWYYQVILFCSVWIIYTMDRVLDSTTSRITERHSFHHRWKNRLMALIALAVLGNAGLLYLVEAEVVRRGIWLGSICCVYLFLVWKKFLIPKEFLIAALYTLGVSLVPVALGNTGVYVYLLLTTHMLLAFMNLLILSYFDMEVDRERGQYNFAARLKGNIRLPLYLIAVVLVIPCYLYFDHTGNMALPILLMFMSWSLVFIYHLGGRLFDREWTGLLADTVFLVPGLIYWL